MWRRAVTVGGGRGTRALPEALNNERLISIGDLIMSIRSRIARALLVAVLGCGLALGASAAGAAADQLPTIGVLATPNPVHQGSNVTLIATVGGSVATPDSAGVGEVLFEALPSGAALGTADVQPGSGPISITVPVNRISAIPGTVTIAALLVGYDYPYPEDSTTLTMR